MIDPDPLEESQITTTTGLGPAEESLITMTIGLGLAGASLTIMMIGPTPVRAETRTAPIHPKDGLHRTMTSIIPIGSLIPREVHWREGKVIQNDKKDQKVMYIVSNENVNMFHCITCLMAGPSLGLISGRHSAPFPTPNSIFFSQIDSSKFPTEHSQICWPKLVQSNDIYSSNSVLLSFINVQMALVNAVFKGYYHWSVLSMRVVYLHKTALPLKRHSNVDYYWLRNRK